MNSSFAIFPLGDSAMTLELGHLIDEQVNRRVLTLEAWLRERPFSGLKDIIVAYSSITVFYDPAEMSQSGWSDNVHRHIRRLLEEAWVATEGKLPCFLEEREPIRIPVCYGGGFGPDLEGLSGMLKISPEDIIRLHSSFIYRVYMIGFLPGFPYLGRIDPRLETGRKSRPAPVAAGGVGIAGNQTGIYPVNSPGGWQIIGRTPVKLFDPKKEPPVRLNIGDQVQFYAVSKEEFETLSE
ncbi:MAG TPA: 5-oxoprolinase subunit PxpB [Puia sp.]